VDAGAFEGGQYLGGPAVGPEPLAGGREPRELLRIVKRHAG
jgi:hypothetical protein